jgi:transcriptional regulator with XRE-family HTH domain
MTRATEWGRLAITEAGSAVLKDAIRQGPLSQSEVARRANVAQSTLNDVLSGVTRTVPVDRARAICHALNLHLGDVFTLPARTT